MNFFTVNHLTAGYGSKSVLKDISFSLDRGCLLGILGANGSGKTTLLKALCNLLPHEGSCTLEGTPLEKLKPAQMAKLCGYIPREAASPCTFPPWMWSSWALIPIWACWNVPRPP